MTLILTVANSRGVFQSSDFRLTEVRTGGFLSDKAGSKQIAATRSDYQLQLAFTGIASVGAKRTVDWLGDELRSSPADASLEFLCHALAVACRRELKSLAGRHILSIVLLVARLGKPFQVAELTNEQWEGRRSRPSERFEVRIHTVRKPFISVAGCKGCLSREDRMALAALARADLPPEEMMDRLAAINAAAAKRSRGLVSEECWTSAFYGDAHTRRSALKDHGSQSGNVGQQFMGIDMAKLLQENLRAAPGEEVRITPLGCQTASNRDPLSACKRDPPGADVCSRPAA
jgi:hypothetical protein